MSDRTNGCQGEFSTCDPTGAILAYILIMCGNIALAPGGRLSSFCILWYCAVTKILVRLHADTR